MSSDSSDEVTLESIVHGACDYLIKPIQPDPITLVWQHVVRSNTKNSDDSSSSIGYLEVQENKPPQPQAPAPLTTITSGNLFPEIDRSIANEIGKELGAAGGGGGGACSSNSRVSKRRNEAEPPQEGAEPSEHYTTAKKPRLIWTPELHHMFVAAVNSLTVEKAVPKKILEYMRSLGVPDLTRENVASHLQKYRLYLRRMENNEQEKSSNLPSQSVSLNGSKESNFKQSSPPDQAYYIENSNSSCSSTNHLPLQSLTEHERSLVATNQAINVLPPLDQTHFLDQNMLQASRSHVVAERQPPSHNPTWRLHGGTAAGFQNLPTSLAPAIANLPNMAVQFIDSQRNTVWAMQNPQPQPEPVVQTFHGDEIFPADFSLVDGIPHPRAVSDQYSNIDGSGLHPIRTNSGDFSVFLDEFFYGSPTNLIEDYEHGKYEALSFGNLRVDGRGNSSETNFYVSDASSDAFSYANSVMLRSTLEHTVGHDRRTKFYPPGSSRKTTRQTLGIEREEKGIKSPFDQPRKQY